VDGLVALPLDGRNREQLEWLADGILEAGGEAWLWVADPAPAAQGRRLAAALQASIAEQYRAVMVEARRAAAAGSADRRMLGRLRRELDRVRRRDYFPPPEREEAKRVVEALAASLGERAA